MGPCFQKKKTGNPHGPIAPPGNEGLVKEVIESSWESLTLPETNSSPRKMDGWNTILSYWVSAYFQGLC